MISESTKKLYVFHEKRRALYLQMQFTAGALTPHPVQMIVLPQKQVHPTVAQKITWRRENDALPSRYEDIGYTNNQRFFLFKTFRERIPAG